MILEKKQKNHWICFTPFIEQKLIAKALRLVNFSHLKKYFLKIKDESEIGDFGFFTEAIKKSRTNGT